MALGKNVFRIIIAQLLLAGGLFGYFAFWKWSAPVDISASDTEVVFTTSTNVQVSSFCDLNGDGLLDENDVAILKLYWKGFPDPSLDCDKDGSLDARNLAIILASWSGREPSKSVLPLPSGAAARGMQAAYHLAMPAPPAGARKIGDVFTALLLLSTNGNTVASGEAVLTFDARRLAIKSLHTSPSLWTIWMERPHVPYGSRLVFAGGRPGGFDGSNGVLAEIEFEVVAPGPAMIQVDEASRAYRPGKTGTPAKLSPFAVDASAPVFGDIQKVTSSVPAIAFEAGSSPAWNASDVLAIGPVIIPAVRVQALGGSRWIIDLSMLAPIGAASYEIREGVARSYQTEDIYALQDSKPGAHLLQVSLIGLDGVTQWVTVSAVIPGALAITSFWELPMFWTGFELAIAFILLVLLIHRQHRLHRRITLSLGPRTLST